MNIKIPCNSCHYHKGFQSINYEEPIKLRFDVPSGSFVLFKGNHLFFYTQ